MYPSASGYGNRPKLQSCNGRTSERIVRCRIKVRGTVDSGNKRAVRDVARPLYRPPPRRLQVFGDSDSDPIIGSKLQLSIFCGPWKQYGTTSMYSEEGAEE